jgi:hypothetical protein
MVRSSREKDEDDHWAKRRENLQSAADRDKARGALESKLVRTSETYPKWITGTDAALPPTQPPPGLILPGEPTTEPKARLIGLGSRKDREKAKLIKNIRDHVGNFFNPVERHRSNSEKLFLQYLYFLQKFMKKATPKLEKMKKTEVSFAIEVIQFGIKFANYSGSFDAERELAELKHRFGMLKRRCS